jgi:hypothetical protein
VFLIAPVSFIPACPILTHLSPALYIALTVSLNKTITNYATFFDHN